MVAATVESTIEGVVSRTNDHGFQLAGRDDWMNLSKFAQPTPLLPRKGMRVEVGLDQSGYVRTVSSVRSSAEALPEPLGPAGDLLYLTDAQRSPELTRPAARKAAPAVQPVMEVLISAGHPPDKDVRITRMNALTTATAIASSGGRQAEIDEVLQLAARLEAWVSR
jgi:hypothetical protein